MIPKRIHYCQFGGKPLNRLSRRCLDSWMKFLPDYEIVEWNETNFDVNQCDFTREAYAAKNYAYLSDYARFWILYHHGGIYFDTDVELLRSLEDIIELGPFMGCEQSVSDCKIPLDLHVNPGIGIAACPGMPFIYEMLHHYQNIHFVDSNGIMTKSIVFHTTEHLLTYDLTLTSKCQKCAGFTIYPYDYFCPKNYYTGKITLTDNTISIHHYGSSWLTPYGLWFQWMTRHMPKTLDNIKKIYRITLKPISIWYSGYKI